MENFFNYIAKPMDPDDVELWFNINNIIFEKLELYYDFCFSLYQTILITYLGDNKNTETQIVLSDEDNLKHFEWCWKKNIDSFSKEEILFNSDGEHFEFFKSFFVDIFYNQKEGKMKDSIGTFFNDLFDRDKPYTKSDLDLILSIYKSLDKNIKI